MKKLLIGAALALIATAASAQQYVPNHAFPLGRGAGVIGFHSVGPCSSGMPVVSAGGTSDPVCLSSQTANTVFAGPTTGSAANPTWRGLVSADIPASVALTGTPTAPTATGGTNTTQLATTAFVQTAIGSSVTTAGANTFTGTNRFQNFLSYGVGAPVGTTDILGYSSTTNVKSRMQRDANLSIGAEVGRWEAYGKNASATSGTWAYTAYGVNDCLWKYAVTGVAGAPICFGNENTAGNEEGAINFFTANGFGSQIRNAKVDNSGLTVYGTGNVAIQNGQGVVWPDSVGTPTYGVSFNSQHLDFQSCNGITSASCTATTNSIRFLTNQIAAANEPAMEIVGDGTIIVKALGGTNTAGSHAICVDSSNRLFKSTGTTCP